MIINMVFSVVVILLSGLVFAAIHSLLASQWIKKRAYSHRLSQQQYRLGYVVIALALTLVWLSTIHQLPDQALYTVHGPTRWLLYGIQTAALLLFWLSLKPIDVRAFLGFKPFYANKEPFIEQGVYRYLRHPMYSSLMLIMLCMPDQTTNSVTLYTLVALYFIIGSRLEEQRMLIAHPDYADYRARVPAFIPCRRKAR
jgi:protein-S-isoprenylcysteine O-methyltransferase Ste14